MKIVDNGAAIAAAVEKCKEEPTDANMLAVLNELCMSMYVGGSLYVPTEQLNVGVGDPDVMVVTLESGETAMIAYTDTDEDVNDDPDSLLYVFTQEVLETVAEVDSIAGLIINPWKDSFIMIDKEEVKRALKIFGESDPFMSESE